LHFEPQQPTTATDWRCLLKKVHHLRKKRSVSDWSVYEPASTPFKYLILSTFVEGNVELSFCWITMQLIDDHRFSLLSNFVSTALCVGLIWNGKHHETRSKLQWAHQALNDHFVQNEKYLDLVKLELDFAPPENPPPRWYKQILIWLMRTNPYTCSIGELQTVIKRLEPIMRNCEDADFIAVWELMVSKVAKLTHDQHYSPTTDQKSEEVDF